MSKLRSALRGLDAYQPEVVRAFTAAARSYYKQEIKRGHDIENWIETYGKRLFNDSILYLLKIRTRGVNAQPSDTRILSVAVGLGNNWYKTLCDNIGCSAITGDDGTALGTLSRREIAKNQQFYEIYDANSKYPSQFMPTRRLAKYSTKSMKYIIIWCKNIMRVFFRVVSEKLSAPKRRKSARELLQTLGSDPRSVIYDSLLESISGIAYYDAHREDSSPNGKNSAMATNEEVDSVVSDIIREYDNAAHVKYQQSPSAYITERIIEIMKEVLVHWTKDCRGEYLEFIKQRERISDESERERTPDAKRRFLCDSLKRSIVYDNAAMYDLAIQILLKVIYNINDSPIVQKAVDAVLKTVISSQQSNGRKPNNYILIVNKNNMANENPNLVDYFAIDPMPSLSFPAETDIDLDPVVPRSTSMRHTLMKDGSLVTREIDNSGKLVSLRNYGILMEQRRPETNLLRILIEK